MTEVGEGWGSFKNAARFRDYLRRQIREVLAEDWPGMKFGTISAIDRAAGKCQVVYQGDPAPVTVQMFSLQPVMVGQAVIIDGPRNRRYISQILGNVFIPGVGVTGWLQVVDNPLPSSGPGSASIGTRAYFMGGDDSLASTSMVSYDTELNAWVIETDMPEARLTPAACAIDSDVYVVGGNDGSVALDSIRRYDSLTGTWDSTLADMPTIKSAPGVAVFDGMIYVFGGLTSDGPPTYDLPTQVYDPGTDTWTTGADIPNEMKYVAAERVGDYILILGTDAATDEMTLHQYNPALDSFTTLASMPESWAAFGVATLGEKVVVTGGLDVVSFQPSAKVYSYDPILDAWSTIQDLPMALAGGTLQEANGKLVFTGGVLDVSDLTPLPYTFVYNPA